MELLLTEEQQMLSQTARDFIDRHAPISRARAQRWQGPDRALWDELAALGWPALLLPEAFDGIGMGLAELATVMEAVGRTLAPTPLVSLTMAIELLLHTGDDAWLSAIASGQSTVTVACHEPFLRGDLSRTQTRAEVSGGIWRLTGEKTAIPDAGMADAILVCARGEAGLGVFLVDRPDVTAESRLDGRDSGRLRLAGTAAQVVVAPGRGEEMLPRAMDRATVALCAEMLGGMQAAFEMTLSYLKTREQFGQPIGAFQALQHRAARMFIDIELCRSAVLAAARVADARGDGLPAVVSMAKARCSEVFLHVAKECVQMHGGIGVTEEHDAGLFLKRAQVAAVTLGSPAQHRDRWARLRGY